MKKKQMILTVVTLMVATISLGLGMAPVVYAGIITVDMNHVGCVSGPQSTPYAVVYCDIQDGINDATSGDTINVAAGTYTENLVIDKQLILQGAGCGVTTVDATGGNGIKILSSDVTIKDLSITGASGHGILITPGATSIRDNIVLDNLVITGSTGHGVRLDNAISVDNLQVLNCQITNNVGIGINSESDTSVTNLLVSDSNIDYNKYGIYLEMEAINVRIQRTTMNYNSQRGYWGSNGRVVNLIFEDCEANGNGQRGITVWSYDATNGIEGPVLIRRTEMNNNGFRGFHIGAATSYSETVAATVKNVLVEDSSILNNGNRGIHVDLGLLENVVVRNSNIVGNSQFGVKHDNFPISSGVVTATCNWWGDPSGPTHSTNDDGVGDTVSDNVSFDPWLKAEEGDICPPPWFVFNHFKCYAVKEPKGLPKFEPLEVFVTDQFGEETLTVKKPKYLAVPALKEEIE